MLNTLADIKTIWQGDAIHIDDSVPDENHKSAFDRFIEREGAAITRRLGKWVGAAAIADAAQSEPVDPDRAQALREAEMSLIHAAMITQMLRANSVGVETDVTLPSGFRLSLSVFTREDYEEAITMCVQDAYTAAVEWIL